MTPSVALTGQLNAFFETGTEGVIWAVSVDGLLGYDSLLPLENGDGLLIYGPNGEVAWEGTVDLEYERRQRAYPSNPQYSQQEVCGYWVHGLQRDQDPETWAQAFIQEAPAVVRSQPRQHADWPARQAFLAQLATDPVGALASHHQRFPTHEVKNSLAWALNYLGKRLGWKEQPPLETEEDQAKAWQLYFALQQAERAAWPYTSEDSLEPLANRWPTLASLTPAEVEQWAQHRLPHDPPGPTARALLD